MKLGKLAIILLVGSSLVGLSIADQLRAKGGNYAEKTRNRQKEQSQQAALQFTAPVEEQTFAEQDMYRPEIAKRQMNQMRALECIEEFQQIITRLFMSMKRSLSTSFRNGIRMTIPLTQELVRNLFFLIISPQCRGVLMPPFVPLVPEPPPPPMSYKSLGRM